jgi:hypothetical protein
MVLLSLLRIIIADHFCPRRGKNDPQEVESDRQAKVLACKLRWQFGEAMLKRIDHQLKTIRDAKLGED